MKIVIINYGAGNIQSIKFAIRRMGFEAILSDDAKVIRQADKVIFPGVGEASSAMRKLRDSGLDDVIPKLRQPVLGICLGMQLMCNYSEEGNTKGLGIFDVEVVRFPQSHSQVGADTSTEIVADTFADVSADTPAEPSSKLIVAPTPSKTRMKIPQIGWNQISGLKTDLFRGIDEGSHIYLVHSFYAPICKETIAESDYGSPYSAALGQDNFYGTQFHPEKSSDVGEKILKNFLEM